MTLTKDELNLLLCAVILTLDEVDYSPVSALYQGTGSNPEKWQVVKDVLELGHLATFAADNTVRLTPAGRKMAEKINAHNESIGIRTIKH